MTSASFKDLCVDATDAPTQARFWASVLGARVLDPAGGPVRLVPASGRPAEAVWVNPVPEPRGPKTRVHLDLRLAGPEPEAILAAGATVVRPPDGEDRWWVLADPEGNEFCAFPAKPGQFRPAGVYELVVDCRDALGQATWWSGIVGGRVRVADHATWAWIEDAAGFPWQYWVFTEVPEPKTVKNRVHWDVYLAAPGPRVLLDAGATLVRDRGGDIDWWVLADPEGNEFCAFAPES